MEATVKVTKEMKGNVCTLRVFGILDFSTMEPFVKEVQSIEYEVSKVIVDFEKLEFIDSTGIGAIINLVHAANSKKFTVEFIKMGEEIMELFDTIGVFTIMESLLEKDRDSFV
ncbi:STAS domain-containing protein [Virgibacillus senegalensis]|uniref:STAS domain-containing protein n=1 Tax=Virgibacillus senegalensis TaxID=1499679 RepID=UPI000A925283|nr:STAS domain-containing protein [Virgibacillus senegalensis]